MPVWAKGPFVVLCIVLAVATSSPGCGAVEQSLSRHPLPPAASDVRGTGTHLSGMALRPELQMQLGHPLPIGSFAINREGTLLASGGGRTFSQEADGQIKIWERLSGRLLKSFIANPKGVIAMAFDPAGRRLVSLGTDDILKVWELSNSRLCWSDQDVSDRHQTDVMLPNGMRMVMGDSGGVEFSSDGRWLITRGINVYDATSGNRLHTLEVGGAFAVRERDNMIAAVACEANNVHILGLYSIATGKRRDTVVSVPGRATSIRFDATGNRLIMVVRGNSPEVLVVDLVAKRVTARWTTTRVPLTADFVDASHALVLEEWGALSRWNILVPQSPEWRDDADMSLPEGTTMAFTPNRMWCFVPGFDAEPTPTSTEDGKRHRFGPPAIQSFDSFLPIRTNGIWLSPSGRWLGWFVAERTILWDLDTGVPRGELSDPLGRLAFAAGDDGEAIVQSSEQGLDLELLSVARRNVPRWLAGPKGGDKECTFSVAVSNDGQLAATGTTAGRIAVWDVRRQAFISEFRNGAEPNAHISSLAFSPDGRSLVVGNWSGNVRMWSVGAGAAKRIWESRVGMPERREPATQDGSPQTRAPDTESPVYLMAMPALNGTFVAVSPTGRFVAFAKGTPSGEPAAVYVADASNGRVVKTLNGHSGGVLALGFVDEDVLISGGRAGELFYWDWKRSSIMSRVKAHDGDVCGIAIDQKGGRLFTCGSDGTARVWRLGSSQEVVRLASIRQGTWLVITPEGRFDSDDLDDIWGLNWVFPDDPFRALGPEVFLRDYYETRLLARMLHPEDGKVADEFKPVRPLADLNRAQPEVGRLRVQRLGISDRATVSIEVAGGTYAVADGSKRWETEAYDLRLFRDGQLVGQCPEPREDAEPMPEGNEEPALALWRAAMGVNTRNDPRVDRHPDGSATVRFEVRLPHRPGQTVKFTAYAFNRDRVKSETADTEYPIPADLPTVMPVRQSASEPAVWKSP